MKTATKPAFGDLRAVDRWPELPPDFIVTATDATRATYCFEGVQKFARKHFQGRQRVTVAELLNFAADPEVQVVLDHVRQRYLEEHRCRFCGRLEHARWCIDVEAPQRPGSTEPQPRGR